MRHPLVSRSAILAILLALAGCVHVHVHTGDVPQAGLGLEPGDRVLARWREGLWPATVITVAGNLVRVAWDTPPPEQSYVPREWVAPLVMRPESLAMGDWVLCNVDRWQVCYVEAVMGQGVTVTAVEDGSHAKAQRNELVALPDDLRPWALKRGEAALKKIQLARQLDNLTPATAGEPATVGQRVLARWQGNSWWLGTVKSTEPTLTVSWADGSGDAELTSTGVAPLPSQPSALNAGDLALCAWASSARWWRAHILSRSNTAMQVEYRDGTQATVPAGQCVLAVHGSS